MASVECYIPQQRVATRQHEMVASLMRRFLKRTHSGYSATPAHGTSCQGMALLAETRHGAGHRKAQRNTLELRLSQFVPRGEAQRDKSGPGGCVMPNQTRPPGLGIDRDGQF